MQRSRNIAARVGRWSAQHRKTAILGWLGFVIASLVFGMGMGTNKLDNSQAGVGESGQAGKVTADAFPTEEAGGEQVLIQSRKLETSDSAFRSAIDDTASRLRKVDHVSEVITPYTTDGEGHISKDRHSALVEFTIKGDMESGKTRVLPTQDAVHAAAKVHPEVRIEQAGDLSIEKAVTDKDSKEGKQAEMLSIPVTLLILVLAFGTLVAAGLPVLLAFSGVLATLGLVGPISKISPVSGSISSMIMMIGLAVGVDYSMFYLKRVREEREAGRGKEAAIEAAAATSGRAVLISGFTVMIAMGGMYLAGNSIFTSFATGSIAAVAVAVLGSLTVLPAVLSKLGDSINKGRVPLLGRVKRRMGVGIWTRIIDRVLRRPLVSALVAGGLLLALSVPVLGMHTALGGIDDMPRDTPEMKTYDKIQAKFPSESMPSLVVVKADDVTKGPVAGAIKDLTNGAEKRTKVYTSPTHVEISKNKQVAEVILPTNGTSDEAGKRALEDLRGDLVPATVGQLGSADSYVTGPAAFTEDFNSSMSSHMIYVFAFVLGAAFLLLLVTFRSIVIALKAILLNLLSVGSAYGILVLVFQDGHGESLLGFKSTGAITGWLPLFLFVVLFGLSMDYHVFILSRVREAYDSGMSTADAVAHGIKSTAGVVTSAAMVMVAVFASFATQSSLDMKQLGVGLAAAVLIDATIIRGVLLPATMKLLGDWNWWLPKKLSFLPKLEHEGQVAPAQA